MVHKDTDCEILHLDVVDKVRSTMPKEPILNEVSTLFKIMGDNTRSRILWALDQNEMCVCDLAALLNMTKSAISHQLRLLREAHLVRFHREGKNVFYVIDDDHVKDIFEKAVEHIIEKNNPTL
ncbi:MAG: winged helix-turn-helix transcriptional regulator [Synergistaceae bacterium]|nr:winged helix-turn-helix transcriptional regulator [Synergistaceae bacterium]